MMMNHFLTSLCMVSFGFCRRSLWNGRIEIVYISANQVVIKSVQEEAVSSQFNPVVIRSQPGLEIESVSLLFLKMCHVNVFLLNAFCFFDCKRCALWAVIIMQSPGRIEH